MRPPFNRYFPVLGLAVILFAFAASAVYVAHSDIMYDADIARDFLILQEIKEKTVVLIGPRSGAAPGLFHGPLWSYLNFPAFILSHGDPVAVGWFWIFLHGLFLISCWFVGKRLLGPRLGLLFTAMISVRMISFVRGCFNPHGALFILPLYFYFLFRYLKTTQLPYLIGHIFLGGLLIQFQVAVGGPFLLLSSSLIIHHIIRYKFPAKHLLAYSLILLVLSTYLLFDLRHDFLMLSAVKNYLTNGHHFTLTSLLYLLSDRWSLMTTKGLFFFMDLPWAITLNRVIFAVLVAALIKSWLYGRSHQISIWAYFYGGFYLISIIQTGGMGVYYYFPLIPLIFFYVCASFRHIPRWLTGLILIAYFGINLPHEISKLHQDLQGIGQSQMSWQFHNQIARTVFSAATQAQFGYFLYAPDVQGYRSKYPFIYQQQFFPDHQFRAYQKHPETFLLLAGPPEYGLLWETNPTNFKVNSVRINSPPVNVWNFPDQYRVEQYYLSAVETEEPFDQHLNNWLHFR